MEHGRVQMRSGKGNPGLSSTTVRSVHLTLHCAFERAVKERLIPRNFTDDCIAPKVQKIEMKTLLPEQLKSCLNAVNARDIRPCSTWSWSAVCGKGNWWHCSGPT